MVGRCTGNPPGRPPDVLRRVESEFGKSIYDILNELYVVQNLSTKAVAQLLRVESHVIPEWCRQCGIPVRKPGGFVQFRKEDRERIVALYTSGMSADNVAKTCGCKSATVLRCVRESGGVVRTRREAVPRKHTVNGHYFDEIDTDMKAYFLGYLAADGCITHNDGGWCMRLKLKADDIEILEVLRQELETESPIGREINRSLGKDFPQVRLCVASADLCEALIRHGITPRKSATLEPPKGVPNHLLHHFVRGFFDGDGSVLYSHRGKSYLRTDFCGTPMMLRWLTEVFQERCGLPPNKLVMRTDTFGHLDYSCSKAIVIRDFMYPTGNEFGLSRKKNKLFSVA
jgi:transposase